jgi:thioredoxin reductase
MATLGIIGAGPIGLECGLYAAQKGWDVDIFERDTVGSHIRNWGHVEFFSPWRLNRSPWSERALREAGHTLAPEDECPTGRRFVEDYLEPLSRLDALANSVHTGTEVVEVARRHALKDEFIGADGRTRDPFLLHLRSDDGETYARADAVVDATGVYHEPNGLGPGGLRAVGERTHRDRIAYDIPDILGADRDTYREGTTLVVGSGYSAVTSLRHLAELRQQEADVEVVWLRRHPGEPYDIIEDDPLTQRSELSKWGNAAARGEVSGITPVVGTVESIQGASADDALEIGLDQSDRASLTVDRIIGNVGYRPDNSLHRELQVHQCYATEGPIDLAATLLGGDSADCLDQESAGAEALTNPEPNFFMLGAKSYGRNSSFLLKIGFQQIRDVVDGLLPELDAA